MGTHTITLELPDELYQRLLEQAARSQRGIQSEAIALLATVLPPEPVLPVELEVRLRAMAAMPDDQLWRLARQRMPAAKANELSELNDKGQRQGLTAEERQRQHHLIQVADQVVLKRAEAAHLLKQRGHDISVLLKQPT